MVMSANCSLCLISRSLDHEAEHLQRVGAFVVHTLNDLMAGRLQGTARLNLSCGLTSFPREVFDLADSLGNRPLEPSLSNTID